MSMINRIQQPKRVVPEPKPMKTVESWDDLKPMPNKEQLRARGLGFPTTPTQWITLCVLHRAEYYDLYSFGGGIDSNGRKRSRKQCANMIVRYNKCILKNVKLRGRKPIAGELPVTNVPTTDKVWLEGQIASYNLHLSIDEVYSASDTMVNEREVNQPDVTWDEILEELETA